MGGVAGGGLRWGAGGGGGGGGVPAAARAAAERRGRARMNFIVDLEFGWSDGWCLMVFEDCDAEAD